MQVVTWQLWFTRWEYCRLGDLLHLFLSRHGNVIRTVIDGGIELAILFKMATTTTNLPRLERLV